MMKSCSLAASTCLTLFLGGCLGDAQRVSISGPDDRAASGTPYKDMVDADGLTYEDYLQASQGAPNRKRRESGAVSLLGGRIPSIDSKNSCREARGFSAAEFRDADYANCLDDEASAREQLASAWPTFKLADRQSCVELVRPPTPRYVELLTCVEMNAGEISTGRIAARSNRKKLVAGSLTSSSR